jgi:RNA polymerase sigma-70 factor (ECF subfamily)
MHCVGLKTFGLTSFNFKTLLLLFLAVILLLKNDYKMITKQYQKFKILQKSTIMATNKFQSNLMKLQSNLLNFAFLLTANREDALDLLQDTTLKALDNEEKFAENTNFKGWVFTIMRNIFINNYRRAGRAATVVDTTENLFHLNLSQDSGLTSPEGAFTEGEINAAINAFPDEYRVPFSMHITGYKYNEIAEHMNLPLGTVKSRIFFARKKLQERFSDYR